MDAPLHKLQAALLPERDPHSSVQVGSHEAWQALAPLLYERQPAWAVGALPAEKLIAYRSALVCCTLGVALGGCAF